MNCEQVTERMHAALDGSAVEFPEDVEGHLAACPECARSWEELRESERLMRATARGPLHVRVMDAIRDEQAATALKRRRWMPFAAAAAVVIGGAGSMLFAPRDHVAVAPAVTPPDPVTLRLELPTLPSFAPTTDALEASGSEVVWVGTSVISAARNAARFVVANPSMTIEATLSP